ncbi:hypothetical protein D3C71_324100 [compost metagenome]
MSGLYPTNGTSVLAATPTNDGIVDSMVGDLNYLAQALRDNAAPLPQAPVMGGAQLEDKLDATPSFAPGRTFH